MFRLLIGIVIGIFIGVLVVAPNPELGDRFRTAWDESRRMVLSLVSDAQDAAGEAVGEVRDATERAAGAVREGADEVREETAPPREQQQ
jgi:hypothetical protein